MDKKEVTDDDLMDLLEDSTKDFDKKLKIEEPTVAEEVKAANEADAASLPKVEIPQPDGSAMNFEDMAKNLEGMDFEKMGFKKEEFEQANSMFKKMMGDFEG